MGLRLASMARLDASPLRCQRNPVKKPSSGSNGATESSSRAWATRWTPWVRLIGLCCFAPACGLDLALAPRDEPTVTSAPTPPVTDAGRDSSAPSEGGEAKPQPVSDAEAPCVPTPTAADASPKTEAFAVSLGGQTAWVHDDKKSAGYFHTFDALVPKAGAEAHKVHVFLPRGYAGGCKRYPVVYMNDGNTSFWPGGSANKTWGVAEVLETAYANKSVREIIVVAIEPVDRNREYTHTPWLLGESCCGASTYATFLADALVPFVDATYRTKSARSDRFTLGSSHGGLAAFFVAARRPETFGGAMAMSSSFWVGQDDRLTGTIGGALTGSALLAQVGPSLAGTTHPTLYLDWGLVRDGGVHNSVIEERATARGREMASLLETATYRYTRQRDLFLVEDPRGEHEEISWGRRLGGALAAIVGP